MIVTEDSIKTSSWKALYDVLKNSALMSYVNRLYADYPMEFIEDAKGLPFAILSTPDVIGSPVTLDNSTDYDITFDIEVVVGEESEISRKTKEISDLVNSIILDAQDTLESSGLYNYVMLSDSKDFDIVNGNKIMYDIITVRFTYFGG